MYVYKYMYSVTPLLCFCESIWKSEFSSCHILYPNRLLVHLGVQGCLRRVLRGRGGRDGHWREPAHPRPPQPPHQQQQHHHQPGAHHYQQLQQQRNQNRQLWPSFRQLYEYLVSWIKQFSKAETIQRGRQRKLILTFCLYNYCHVIVRIKKSSYGLVNIYSYCSHRSTAFLPPPPPPLPPPPLMSSTPTPLTPSP